MTQELDDQAIHALFLATREQGFRGSAKDFRDAVVSASATFRRRAFWENLGDVPPLHPLRSTLERLAAHFEAVSFRHGDAAGEGVVFFSLRKTTRHGGSALRVKTVSVRVSMCIGCKHFQVRTALYSNMHRKRVILSEVPLPTGFAEKFEG